MLFSALTEEMKKKSASSILLARHALSIRGPSCKVEILSLPDRTDFIHSKVLFFFFFSCPGGGEDTDLAPGSLPFN